MVGSGSVIDWLLDSDPSIRWQVMRDLLGVPESPSGDVRMINGGDQTKKEKAYRCQ